MHGRPDAPRDPVDPFRAQQVARHARVVRRVGLSVGAVPGARVVDRENQVEQRGRGHCFCCCRRCRLFFGVQVGLLEGAAAVGEAVLDGREEGEQSLHAGRAQERERVGAARRRSGGGSSVTSAAALIAPGGPGRGREWSRCDHRVSALLLQALAHQSLRAR
jgi:hypothetical protein